MGIRLASQILNKTPEEVCLRDMDFAALMVPGEILLASPAPTVTITPSGAGHMTAPTPAISGSILQFLFSAGLDGQTYHVEAEVSTDRGQKLRGCGKIKVKLC